MWETRITPEKISLLPEGFIFTFGSNLLGKHGKGAAKEALKWGSIYGQGIGLMGRTYGIPTKDRFIKTLSIDQIRKYVDKFIEDAKNHSDLKFLVTKIGCGLAGYTASHIAPLFKGAIEVENIYLPREFWEIINPSKIVKQMELF